MFKPNKNLKTISKCVQAILNRKEAIDIYFSDKRDKEMFSPQRSNKKNDAYSSNTLKNLGLVLRSKLN